VSDARPLYTSRRRLAFQPKAYFSVQCTAYMIFMVLVGGNRHLSRAHHRAVIFLFFLMETWFARPASVNHPGRPSAARGIIFRGWCLPRALGRHLKATGLRLLPVGYLGSKSSAGTSLIAVGKIHVGTAQLGDRALSPKPCAHRGAEVIGRSDPQCKRPVAIGSSRATCRTAAGVGAITAQLPPRFDRLCNSAVPLGAPGALPWRQFLRPARALSEALRHLPSRWRLVNAASISAMRRRQSRDRGAKRMPRAAFRFSALIISNDVPTLMAKPAEQGAVAGCGPRSRRTHPFQANGVRL